MLDGMAVGYVVVDSSWTVVRASHAAERMLRIPHDGLVGGVLWELFPDMVGTVYEERYRAAAATGEAAGFEAYYPEPLNAWYEITAVPEPGGMALYFLDVTARHEHEHVRDLAAQRLAAVAGLAMAMADMTTIEELVTRVAEHGLSVLGCDGGAVTVIDPDGATLRSYVTASYGQAAVGEYGLLPVSALLPAAEAARTGRTVMVRDRDACVAYSEELARVVKLTGSQAFVSLPLRAGPDVLGVVTAGWDRPQPFDADQLALLETFAAQCAQSLHRLQALSAERAAAARVAGMAAALQRSLLTDLPEPDHLELVARYVPAADEAQVGGDWYDAFVDRDGSTLLVIGDVTGHDQQAAVQMAQVRNVLRGIAHALGESPAVVLRALDRAVQDLAIATLSSVVLARVEQTPDDARHGRWTLRWSNAGHPPPLVVAPDGRTEFLDRPHDLLLGVRVEIDRNDHTYPLQPGSTLLLYTDGLIERRGEDLGVGLEVLAETVGRLAHLPLQELCDALVAELAPAAQDDVALLAVRAHPQDRPRPPEAEPRRLPANLVGGA